MLFVMKRCMTVRWNASDKVQLDWLVIDRDNDTQLVWLVIDASRGTLEYYTQGRSDIVLDGPHTWREPLPLYLNLIATRVTVNVLHMVTVTVTVHKRLSAASRSHVRPTVPPVVLPHDFF